MACGLHYAAVHGRELSTGSVSHPNQWYLESRGEAGPGARHTNNIKTTKAQVCLHGQQIMFTGFS